MGVAAAGDDAAPRAEWVPELTPYYTSIGLYVPLTSAALPERRGENEIEIYRELLLNSLSPQVFLVEASVYPMPIAGTYARRHHRRIYDDADLGNDINWIESLTAGLQEPAALSVFLGSALNFVRPGEQRRGTNKGHIGYLLSYGDRHIRENVMISDDWYELEWKLKGERQFQNDHLSWSFRLGTKQHSHQEIADTVYVGLRRSNLDYRAPFLAWLTNSEVALMIGATTDSFALARTEVLVEKRFPVARWGLAFAVQLGAILESERMYVGSLHEDEDNFILVLRPNIEF
jgi:hypothetical protein